MRARAVHYNEQRDTALNEQRAISIRDFKSRRDYGIHAAAQRGKSSQGGSCPGAPGHHIIRLSNDLIQADLNSSSWRCLGPESRIQNPEGRIQNPEAGNWSSVTPGML
jgi:hypothetical protein